MKRDVYVAIIGDIKNSKRIEERNAIQAELYKVLKSINEKYADDISANFVITLGDEFQGLLCSGKHVMNIIENIRGEMYPISIRFGLGIGTITTSINPWKAIGADGPAYYMARSAIENVKQRENQKRNIHTDIRIEICSDNKYVENLLNESLTMMEIIQKSWTARQREIIADHEFYQNGQEKCAKRLGIAQSSVQRALKSANYYQYKKTKDIVNEAIEEIRKNV